MRRTALALALVALVPFAGCLESLQGRLSDIRSEPEPPADFEATFDDAVAPQHSKTYPFPVSEGAADARATVALAMMAEDNDLPVALAQVTIGFRDPSNAPVGESRTLNPQSPSATISLSSFPTFGEYTLVVSGNGLSGPPGGARYNATIAVSYG